MSPKQFHLKRNQRRAIEVFKDYENFNHRLKMAQWADPAKDWDMRINALIQFSATQSTRQILNRASKS